MRAVSSVSALLHRTRTPDARPRWGFCFGGCGMALRKGGRQWRRLRAQALMQEPLCRSCQSKGRVTAAVVVDHIVALVNGGKEFDPNNLQTLCDECHAVKTARDTGKRERVRIGIDGWPEA